MLKNDVFELFLRNSAISIGHLKNGTAVFKDGRGHTLSPSSVLQKYYTVKGFLPEQFDFTVDEVNEILKANSNTGDGSKEQRKPPMQYVTDWLQANAANWRISTNGKRITSTEFSIPRDRDMEDLIIAIQCTVDAEQAPYKEGEITRAVKSYFRYLDQYGSSLIYNKIKFDPKRVAACDKWLRNVYDFFKPTESFEVFSTMMKHWAWQVKRKLMGRKVVHHIWLNFYGAAGTGKTTFIKKMCVPMEDVTSTTTISKIFDDTREIKRLTENLVLIFDELALNVDSEESGKLNADQKAILKSIITGEFIDARVYGTQNQAKKIITFSCISSANNHLYDIIYDETTMRRFFEFHCTAEKVKDFNFINRTLDNSEYFWLGVDEELDRGYFNPDSAIWEEVAAIQASYYPTKSSVYDWIKETDAKAGSIPAAKAYKSYRQYSVNCGFKPKTLTNFVSDLKHAIPDSVRGTIPMLSFTPTDLCKKPSNYDDDVLPGTMNDFKPITPPTAMMPNCSEFI